MNGTDEMDDETVLHLSDLFERKVIEPKIELLVRMLNINAGKKRELIFLLSVMHSTRRRHPDHPQKNGCLIWVVE